VPPAVVDPVPPGAWDTAGEEAGEGLWGRSAGVGVVAFLVTGGVIALLLTFAPVAAGFAAGCGGG
jgi:hypothetical protein